MPRNTVAGGGSFAGHDDIPMNDDARRAIAEGRTPDVVKSAFIGREVTREQYDAAMERHGTDTYAAEDKMVVQNYVDRRSDEERAEAEERDGEAPGARGRVSRETGGASSAGNNSPRSSGKPAKSGASASRDRRSTAQTTGSGSTPDRTEDPSASSTDGSGTDNP